MFWNSTHCKDIIFAETLPYNEYFCDRYIDRCPCNFNCPPRRHWLLVSLQEATRRNARMGFVRRSRGGWTAAEYSYGWCLTNPKWTVQMWLLCPDGRELRVVAVIYLLMNLPSFITINSCFRRAFDRCPRLTKSLPHLVVIVAIDLSIDSDVMRGEYFRIYPTDGRSPAVWLLRFPFILFGLVLSYPCFSDFFPLPNLRS